jgi:hypothetical protein
MELHVPTPPYKLILEENKFTQLSPLNLFRIQKLITRRYNNTHEEL